MSFFICGLPGGIDYGMLAAVKQGLLSSKSEKVANTFLNVWVRNPGLTVVAYIIYVASKYVERGRAAMRGCARTERRLCVFLAHLSGSSFSGPSFISLSLSLSFFHSVFFFFFECRYGRTSMPPPAAAVVSLLGAFNGTYYMQRVVASAGANGWRPS